MKIAVYNRGIPFDGATPSYQPLGGSESSIVYMARELARAGHEVTVYCNLPSPAEASQPRPRPEGEARGITPLSGRGAGVRADLSYLGKAL